MTQIQLPMATTDLELEQEMKRKHRAPLWQALHAQYTTYFNMRGESSEVYAIQLERNLAAIGWTVVETRQALSSPYRVFCDLTYETWYLNGRRFAAKEIDACNQIEALLP